ncbi:hypothetical protein VTN77DRAFT_6654 [Rasamsonia byssochlamydoides]|uniref:uncharacterized protein n=1 Tax=Rasamsonia byssochlamydoides TaxID=89139 RepID=UPI00374300D3
MVPDLIRYSTMTDTTVVLRPRISKSCDQCKARKVRCIRDQADSRSCTNCIKRRQECHFSHTKRRLRQSESSVSPSHDHASAPFAITPTSGDASSGEPRSHLDRHPRLYLDYLLENRHAGGIGAMRNESCIFKAPEHYVASSNLAFFSETRIRSVSERLGHNKLRDLIETIGTVINARLNRGTKSSGATIKFKGPSNPEQVPPDAASAYIAAYFDQVHPMYPFLDRKEFEAKAFSSQLLEYLSSSPPFSALYHTVLALGCQYTEGGSFDPGKGKAWKLFEVALGLFSDLLIPKEALINVQAITAMSIFTLNLSCIQIEETLISEAARMAQSLGYNRAISMSENEEACHRTFWVIYTLEKTTCFFTGRTSDLMDSDVGCPVPVIPEAVFGGFDWFLSSARFSRLVSRAYEMLFSVSARMKTPDQYFAAIDRIEDDLEQWRNSIPREFRPGEPFRPQHCKTPCAILITLRSHFFYYGTIIALCRVTLHVGAGTPSRRLEEAKKRLMLTARHVVENTRYIDAEPYTPIWMLGVIPLSALFILFDFVVHNPSHPETSTNLALLDVAAGYFSRLEYATGGSLPSSLLSDFAHIARQFIRDVQSGKRASTGDAPSGAPYNNTKGFDRLPEAQQDVGYFPAQMGPSQHMPMQSQMSNGVATPFTEQLFYPTTDLQPLIGGEIPAGFDITNLFDSVIPDFMGPL